MKIWKVKIGPQYKTDYVSADTIEEAITKCKKENKDILENEELELYIGSVGLEAEADYQLVIRHFHQKQRSTFDIYRDMINYCMEPVGFTRVMYGCNLSFEQVREYLSQMMQLQFLKEMVDSDGHRFYICTNEGRLFVREYEKLIERFILGREACKN